MGGAISVKVGQRGKEYEKNREDARNLVGGTGGRDALLENEGMDNADGE